jgi:hypothetical protein
MLALNKILPQDLELVTFDLSGCHLRIFAGLTDAPQAFVKAAIQQEDLWSFSLSHSPYPEGQRKAEKRHLKRVVYTALNGGSLSSPESIGKHLLPPNQKDKPQLHLNEDPDLMPIAKEIYSLKLVQELLSFQRDLNRLDYIYLAHMPDRYFGAKEPRGRKDGRLPTNLNHGGLLSSRIFASVEILLIIMACNELLKYGCIPISIESDGFLILAPKDAPLEKIDKEFLRKRAFELVSQEIPIAAERFDLETMTASKDYPPWIKEGYTRLLNRLI